MSFLVRILKKGGMLFLLSLRSSRPYELKGSDRQYAVASLQPSPPEVIVFIITLEPPMETFLGLTEILEFCRVKGAEEERLSIADNLEGERGGQ